MADYASNMWRLVRGEEDTFPHKSFYSFDPFTIYMETDKKDKNKIKAIYFPLSHLHELSLEAREGKFVQFEIGLEQVFLADKERLIGLLDEGRLLEFPHYTGGGSEPFSFEDKKTQTFIDLFQMCIDTLKEKQRKYYNGN